MASVKLRLNTYRSRTDGTFPLVFQIIHRRRKRLLYTPCKLRPEEFDAVAGKVVCISGGRFVETEVRRMNRKLACWRKRLDRCISELESRQMPYTADDLLVRFRRGSESLSLLQYMDLQIERKNRMDKFGTASAYRSTRASLAAFLGGRKVRIHDVDGAFVRAYAEYLIRRGACPNTVCFYLRNLRSLYRRACADGSIPPGEADPFFGLRIRQEQTVKRALERDTLRRLSLADLSGHPGLDFARDLFLFSFYCRGMPFVDVAYLRKSDIANGVIGYRRRKTRQWLQIAVTPRLERLIRKYDNPTPYVFPVLSLSDEAGRHRQYRLALERVNRNLKQVAVLCDVPVALTTSCAS